MPEDSIQEKEEERIEKVMLLFYFLYSVFMTVITVKCEWSVWLALFTGGGWLFGVILYWRKFQTYSFRAYAMTCLMQMSLVLWSVYTESLSMTIPILLILAVILVFYGIPEIIYIPVIVSVFLGVYHLLIKQTVALSTDNEIIQTGLEIICIFLIEYVIYILNKMRMEGLNKQMQFIDSLKEAERSKDDFMANVSHEIRTPINTICGMSEIVLREELSDQVRADVFSIQTAGRNLQSIVSDVLDFTEMQSGKTTLVEEVYNITSTINDVINMSMARKNENQIDLIIDCDANLPSGLIGDEQKIRRVIMNLVNNALKFTVEGCVSILIGSRKTEYGINLVVHVKDTGIGMKKESMEKLFNNFNQVDTKRNRQKEGIGLGLAISQALVDMMGGFITVSSKFGKGSDIQFVIPQKVSDLTPIAEVKDRERVNVAIYVDMESHDRPEVQEAYSNVIYHMIEQLQVKCHVCRNLPELKRRAEREKFTHVFISIEEYEEDKGYFDDISNETKVIAIIEYFNEIRISNPNIQRLYKPFFVLSIVMVLNNKKIVRRIDTNYDYQGRFLAPDANVLVVDDNLMNIRVLEGLLRPYKIKVAIATSGAEALEKIENMHYDVILMDHMMPKMDGVETLQRIRQKHGNYFKKVPVVAVTANAVGGMREVFFNHGFQDFIAKPIEVSVLERVLRRILPQEKIILVQESVIDEKDRTRTKEITIENSQQVMKKTDGLLQVEGEVMHRYTDLPSDSFNEEIGLKYCGGLEGYIQILQLIGKNGLAERNKIQKFYKEKDWKNYTTLVHAVKSTMLSIGVENLSGMAKELELAGKRDDEEYILEHHDSMMLEYARILTLINESKTVNLVKEQLDITDLEEIEEAELDKLAMEFEEAAFSFEHEKMADIAEHLLQCSYQGHPLTEIMQRVMKKVEMTDYLSASEVVSGLKNQIIEDSY